MEKYHFECKPEECLLHVFHVQNNDMKHHNGRGQVCKILSENENLIGLVDADPDALHHPYYIKLYNSSEEEQFGLRFGLDTIKNNKLIFVHPKFEDWLINVVHNTKLKMSDYNLSDDPNLLHGEISSKITNLQTLLHQLIKQNNKSMHYLKSILLR